MVQNKPVLRTANYDDIPYIKDIIKESFKKYKEMCGATQLDALEETEGDIKNDIDNKLVVVAVADGVPVGCVRVQIFTDKTAYLTRFGVKHQNDGIGTMLMEYIDAAMKDKGVKQLYLYTGAKVAEVIRFYYGKGFYIDEIDKSKGYVRAKLIKEY